MEWLAAGQGPLTEARAVGQLRPGVQLEAAPKGAQQLLTQRELGPDLHDPRTDEGRLQQGPWEGPAPSKAFGLQRQKQTYHPPPLFPI